VDHREEMWESDAKVMTAVIYWVRDHGSDRMTMGLRAIAAMVGLPKNTTDHAIHRLVEDGWLVIEKKGHAGRPAKGAVGQATVYSITAGPISPPSRRGVVVRPLSVTPKAGRPSMSHEAGGWDIKEPLVPRTIGSSTYVSVPPPEVVRHREIRPSETRDEEMSHPPETGDETRREELSHPLETQAYTPLRGWLIERLSDGPVKATEVVKDARSAGYSRASVYRAASDIRVLRMVETGHSEGKGKPLRNFAVWELPLPLQR
jgi:hypothetical protein